MNLSDLPSMPRRIVDRLRLGKGVAPLGQNLLDRWRGLDFLVAVPAEAHGFNPDIVYRSAPSGGGDLLRLLRSCNVRPADSMLDIGCGKGNAVRTMRRVPFARVDGLELVPEVASIARMNFDRSNARSTTIFQGDARTFDHYDDYNYLYLCNPFPAEIMEPVVARIETSLVTRPRNLTVIYTNVTCTAFLHSKAFDLVQRSKSRWNLPVDLYRSVQGVDAADNAKS